MRTYLIVDDNAALAENLAEIIRDQGDDAVVVDNGPAAVERARTTRFDALVTDMKMPVMGGAELVHRIRRVDPGLPAIVITAYTGDDDLAGAKHEGILAVLSKPVPVPQLLRLLSIARRNGLVALVEDDVSLADNLAEALRDRGFTAVTAHSAMDAERLGGVKPFAALVDLRLPGSPNGEIVEQLRARFRELPIAIMTGFPHLSNSAPRADLVFEKPFDTQRLLEVLEKRWTPESPAWA